MRMDIMKLCITESKTILEAMKQLDATSMKILYVVDNTTLLGTVTDGDVRRHLLKGGQLTDEISHAANYSPVYIYANDVPNANAIMHRNHISSVPIVNEALEIQDLLFLQDIHVTNKNSVKAPVVIMAGGKGTRLYPYTKILPKPLVPIGDLPIVEHIMNKFSEFGCDEFNYILNHKKQMIKAYFNEEATSYRINFFEESVPLGTGGGLSLLKGHISETFFLSNCDSLLYADYSEIYKFHKEQKNFITMVCVYKHFTIPYGVVSMGENGKILEVQEKPEYSFLTNTGFYVVEPSVLEHIEDNTAIGFPDIIEKLRKSGKNISVYPVSEMSWFDMGQPDEMAKMREVIERI